MLSLSTALLAINYSYKINPLSILLTIVISTLPISNYNKKHDINIASYVLCKTLVFAYQIKRTP